MKKIYEQLSIETWKKIAYRVQCLNISSCSDDEFQSNLLMLKELLIDLDLNLSVGRREPQTESQIGLSSLLNSIYNINGCSLYSKENFYEYIRKFYDLGVKNIEYRPTEFPAELDEKLEFIDDYINTRKIINKCYTDGKFKLSRPSVVLNYQDYNRYVMCDIKDASYILSVKLCHERPYAFTKPYILESNAIIKDFNGILPNKNEFLSTEFPKLKIHSRKINWGESPEYSQIFKTTDVEKIRKLIR